MFEYDPGRLGIYDLTSNKKSDLTFPFPVSSTFFTRDGKKLLLLTKIRSRTRSILDLQNKLRGVQIRVSSALRIQSTIRGKRNVPRAIEPSMKAWPSSAPTSM